MDSEEYFTKRARIVRSLQEYWASEGSAIAVMRFLVSTIGPRDDLGEVAFGVVGCMHDAFEMSLWDTKMLSRWHAIGGDLSDEEIEERIGQLTLRKL
ncbi:hypothetical protein Slala02_74340 [Streptomyces lavendulae subsp. lavendulae]|nr:hypothetical protein Slala01_73960 [Streptomyces lavendulae subsp. lavendulae]GLX31615.1 hypothetical protein Slala02_74340 [Streptomyces lavendulae subsp. lavendulae]